MLAGELKVAAYADLGGLGTKQGPPVSFAWTMPNFLPLLLPWLVVLGLLALPSNRTARAWWIWVPLAGLALLGIGLGVAADTADNEGLGYMIQTACAAAFGLAAVWLLGTGLARRSRALSLVLMTLAFAAVSLLAFVVSPVWEQLWDLRQWEPTILLYLLLFWIAGGLVFAGGLNLTGWMCRKQFSCLRVLFRLPFWLWAMWLAAGSLLACVLTFVFNNGFEWIGILVGPILLALVSFGVILPFLILSFACSFYRERLRDLLRLPIEDSLPAAPTSAPAVETVSPR
ncbi:MAG: hypothetical protein ACLQU3_14915 [Limisphaerales bacterium]